MLRRSKTLWHFSVVQQRRGVLHIKYLKPSSRSDGGDNLSGSKQFFFLGLPWLYFYFIGGGGQSNPKICPLVSRSRPPSSAERGLWARKYQHFDYTVKMFNESMDMCLPDQQMGLSTEPSTTERSRISAVGF